MVAWQKKRGGWDKPVKKPFRTAWLTFVVFSCPQSSQNPGNIGEGTKFLFFCHKCLSFNNIICVSLSPWFSIGGDFVPWGISAMSGDLFGCYSLGRQGRVLLASSRERPGTGPLLRTKNHPGPNVKSATIEKEMPEQGMQGMGKKGIKNKGRPYVWCLDLRCLPRSCVVKPLVRNA